MTKHIEIYGHNFKLYNQRGSEKRCRAADRDHCHRGAATGSSGAGALGERKENGNGWKKRESEN